MPQLEQGNVIEVKKAAEKTAAFLFKKIKEGFKVVTPIASCALMLKSHWPLLSPNNAAVIELSKNAMDADEFLMDLHNKGELNLDLKPLNKNIFHEIFMKKNLKKLDSTLPLFNSGWLI